MTIIETFAQVPLMLYISLVLLPGALWGYFFFSKPKKTIAAAAANPADQLKEKKINIEREFFQSLLLGACVGLGISLTVSLGWVIDDYKNNRGLFAAELPVATYPPSMGLEFPPAPPALKPAME
ncbi:MAG: hypothetical protein MUD10_05165 [Candidatus Pacebacteria bacterium]|jgi:hypothetical protein|nr:hypothetical protein [Candidatus Paceibacterota bacterium]